MQKSIYPFFFILLLSIPCLSQSSIQTFTTRKGEQFQIELKPDKEIIMLGETTFISFEIKNLSGKDFYTGLGLRSNNNGRPTDYQVILIGENGKSVLQPESGGSHGFGGIEKIPANGRYITKLFLPQWATFENPGTYMITVKKNLGIEDSSELSKYNFPVEVATKIKIIPTDRNKLGELIDSLGKKVLDSAVSESVDYVSLFEFSVDDARLFAFIEDQRVIKYHIKILEKFGQKDFGIGNETYLSQLSTWALRKYNDDSALEALKKASTSPNEFVRGEAAKSLRDSLHPKAIEALLAMQNDENSFVRLIVVTGLEKLSIDESNPLLYKMLKDKDQTVRVEAQRILDKRGPK